MKVLHEQARIDPDSGEVHYTDCPDCQDKTVEIRTLEATLEATQDEHSQLARKYRTLRKRIERDRHLDASRKQVEEVIDDWKKQTGKRDCKLTAQAHDRITARLNEGYTVDHFKLANQACAHDPWPATRKYPDPQIDIRTIAQNGQHLEDYAQRGARWLIREGHEGVTVPFEAKPSPLAVAELRLNEAGQGAVSDPELGIGLAVCPMCTLQMKFYEDGDRVHFDCKTGCTHAQISDAVHVRLGRRSAA